MPGVMTIEVLDGSCRGISTKTGGMIYIQKAYYHDGGPYPTPIEMVHSSTDETLPPGEYEFTSQSFGLVNGRFNLVYGWASTLKKRDGKSAGSQSS